MQASCLPLWGKVAPQGRMRGTFAIFTRWWDTMAGSALISQWSEPLTASPVGKANANKNACAGYKPAQAFLLS